MSNADLQEPGKTYYRSILLFDSHGSAARRRRAVAATVAA